jgi:hypothetical protein
VERTVYRVTFGNGQEKDQQEHGPPQGWGGPVREETSTNTTNKMETILHGTAILAAILAASAIYYVTVQVFGTAWSLFGKTSGEPEETAAGLTKGPATIPHNVQAWNSEEERIFRKGAAAEAAAAIVLETDYRTQDYRARTEASPESRERNQEHAEEILRKYAKNYGTTEEELRAILHPDRSNRTDGSTR